MIGQPNVKINIGLDILRKREDGYHDIETLFVPYFRIHDTLEVIGGDSFSETSSYIAERYDHGSQIAQAISPDGKLMITIAGEKAVGWNPLDDLCAKAYRILSDDFHLGPVKIFLEKKSPVGAGLGGGSSDAAFTLKMLDSLFGLGLSRKELASYAAKLGSDCAFFIYDTPMFGEGRGEILTPFDMDDLDCGQDNVGKDCRYRVEVAVPEGISISTAEAYRGVRADDGRKSLLERLRTPVEEWKNVLENDFEKTVFTLHPELKKMKESLYESGAVYASMSGSGSALFGIYRK